MVDLLEKKLGDLVRELESQRDALRRDLDKVNSQLELLSGLVKGKSSSSSAGSSSKTSSGGSASSKSSGAAGKVKRGRGRPPKSASAAPSTAASTSTKSTGKKKRGRPPKSASKVASTTSKAKSSSSSKSKSKGNGAGGTLKEELLTIAKANNGTFSIKEASKALVKSGRYDTAERAAANIHAAIKYYTSNFFKEGSQRGMYRVKA